jgi:hypothetical protein
MQNYSYILATSTRLLFRNARPKMVTKRVEYAQKAFTTSFHSFTLQEVILCKKCEARKKEAYGRKLRMRTKESLEILFSNLQLCFLPFPLMSW